MSFPYCYISCPCTTSQAVIGPVSLHNAYRRGSHVHQEAENDDEDLKPLDPFAERSQFTLFPYEDLLYCDECHEIRCPRCWTEEITKVYCPNCLFDVPASLVSSDGNRCTRSCYNCPLCTSPLSISALGSSDGIEQASGPYCLICQYCDWSCLDLGLTLSKPNKVTEQLIQLEKHCHSQSDGSLSGSHDAVYARLLTFYQDQLANLNDNDGPNTGYGQGSPGDLAHIMQMYGGLTPAALRKSRERSRPMRDAASLSDGLVVVSDELNQISINATTTKGDTTTLQQRDTHPWNRNARLTSELWPVPAKLVSRRGKRCKICRHILIKLDDRHASMKYKIRLLAQKFIPKIALSLLTSGAESGSAPPTTAINFALTSSAYTAAKDASVYNVAPHTPVQYLLTLTNPLFEPVRVTLATPAITPGPIASRVTILCPSFELGADGDMWDEALGLSAASSMSGAAQDETSSHSRGASSAAIGSGESRQPVAGKVWEKGRNWVRTVIEVVPGALPLRDTSTTTEVPPAYAHGVLEIPVHVRVEWEAEVTASEAGLSTPAAGAKPIRESRENAFWIVLGAGRIIG